MTIIREAARLILIVLALAGIGLALLAAWLVDRAYDAATA